MIIWLIGLSGSGKTTLADAMYEKLKPKYRHLVRLDGDEFRDVFRNDADHTIDGRRKNAERISHFCRVLDGQGIHVLASVLSIFPEWQQWNRKMFSSYFEIYLDVSIDIVKNRDPKGIYRSAKVDQTNNIVGLDIPFPVPPSPDLRITSAMQEQGVEYCVDHIISELPRLD